MKRVLPIVVVAVVLGLALLGWKTGGFGVFSSSDSGPGGTTVHAPEAAGTGPGLKGTAAAPATDPKTFEGDPVGRVDAKRGGAGVTGRVVDAASKAPLRFARVAVVLPPPELPLAVRSTKEGRFEIAGLPAGTWDLRVSASEHLGRTLSTPALADGPPADVGDVALKPRPPQTDGLEVRVSDESGNPVAGAKVSASTMPWGLYVSMGPERAGVSGVFSKEGVTDEGGVARFSPIPPEKYDVVVRADGYALEPVENVVVCTGRVERVRVVVKAGLSISGTIVDRQGVGVPKAYVTALHIPSFRGTGTALADASGAFTLPGLIPGMYWMFAGEDAAGDGQASGITAGSKGVRIELKGAGAIAGRVTYPDGKPATSFTVRPWTPGEFRYVYTRQFEFTDPDGRFRFPASPGTTNLDVAAEGAAVTTVSSVKVEAGATTNVDVKLAPEGVVKGVVTDPDGNHLADAEVFLERGVPPVPVREQYVRTDAEGAFALRGLPLESVKLHARHVSFATTVVDAVPAPPAAAKDVTIRLSRGARVLGRVATKDGTGVANRRVNLYKPERFDLFNAKATITDESGAFAFVGVAVGTYSASVGRFENMAPGPRQTVRVEAEGDVTVNFEVEGEAEATGSVAGRVTVGGVPAANSTVEAYDERGAGHAITAKTDAEGRYVVRGLKPGRITVHVTTASGAEDWDQGRIQTAGQTATVDFALGTASVRFTVAAATTRETVSGAWVTVERAEPGRGTGWENVKSSGQTSNDGKYSATGIEPGTYRVRIGGSGYAALVTEPFPVADGEAKDLGTLLLEAGSVLSGRVIDDAGAPVEAAGISVKNERGEPVFLFSMVTTGSDGRYSVPGLLPGRYSVLVDGRGLAPVERAVTLEGTSGATLDVTLLHGGSIAATVVDDRGAAVEGARIEVYDSKGVRVTKTLTIANFLDADASKTSADGKAAVADLVPGSYSVRASKEGMTLVGDPVVVGVSPRGTAPVRLVLRQGP